MATIFGIEKRVEELFEEMFPRSDNPQPKHDRGFRPVIWRSLGCLVPDRNAPRLRFGDKQYFQIDQDDFLDFATSQLVVSPRALDFPDGESQIFSFFSTEAPALSTSSPAGQFDVALLDGIFSRRGSRVSVTLRLAYREPDTGRWEGGEEDRLETLVTINLLPSNDVLDSELVEYDRFIVDCPLTSDAEWRFIVASGHGCAYETRSYGRDPERQWLARLAEQSTAERPEHELQAEVAHLCLCLPQYMTFMYDLISTEKVRARVRGRRRPSKKRKLSKGDVIYKVVKSIRVVRPESHGGSLVREWTVPRRRHTVVGHWRDLSGEEQMGKDMYGVPTAGRTWVRQHQRGETNSETDGAPAPEPVVIRIKQTLASARDTLTSLQESTESCDAAGIEEKPSRDWMAQERQKLSAGLRYQILMRDRYSCQLCGASATDSNYVRLEVDHIKPVSSWGRTVPQNLQTLCDRCNRGKGARYSRLI